MKRGDWIRLRGRKIAHLVVAVGSWLGNDIYIACCGYVQPRAVYVGDPQAPRCKKCLKAQTRARKERGS